MCTSAFPSLHMQLSWDPKGEVLKIFLDLSRGATASSPTTSTSLLQVVRNTQHGEKYVLHQCGASTEGLAERYPDAKLFQIPLTAVATPSTTVLGFMVSLAYALGLTVSLGAV